MLLVLGLVNVYFYANYLGDLSHYLLLTWLILAIGLAVTVDAVVSLAVRSLGARASVAQYAVLVLPIVLLASNWTLHDQSDNRDARGDDRSRSSPRCRPTRSCSPTGTP